MTLSGCSDKDRHGDGPSDGPLDTDSDAHRGTASEADTGTTTGTAGDADSDTHDSGGDTNLDTDGGTDTDTNGAATDPPRGGDSSSDSDVGTPPDSGEDSTSSVDSQTVESDSGDTGATDRDAGADTSTAGATDTDTGSAFDPDDLVFDVAVHIHEKVSTLLVVTWTQRIAVDEVWIRYTFEDDEWLESPPRSGTGGAHEAVLLGIPELTAVRLRIVFEAGGRRFETSVFEGETGGIPAAMPRPTVLAYHADLASDHRWLIGSVEASAATNRYYTGPFWIYIIDRRGRIVWYYADLIDNPCMAYPRVARDGSHLYVEKRMFAVSDVYAPKVARMTLDLRSFEEVPTPDLDDCIDVTDDGTILFNTNVRGGEAILKERLPDGTLLDIWDCRAWADAQGVGDFTHSCYSNTVSWNRADDTILMSFPYLNTVLEIARTTGAVVSGWGALGSFGFEPSTWEFAFNHFPSITPEGTLIVSSHEPGHENTNELGQHYFAEFDIDREGALLTERWIYGDGIDEWPMYKGEASRLAGGNTLVNYGTGGVIREVTPEMETVWHVKWDAPSPEFPDDHFNNMVGHNILVDDLYALCDGWE